MRKTRKVVIGDFLNAVIRNTDLSESPGLLGLVGTTLHAPTDSIMVWISKVISDDRSFDKVRATGKTEAISFQTGLV
jgi:hypothetical protein